MGTCHESSKIVSKYHQIFNKKLSNIIIRIPVNAFMAYMTGNSLQIIPITMTLMLFTNPLKQIAQIPTLFKKFETPQNSSEIFSAKLIFLLCQIGSMLVGVWRLQNMGLLPTTRSDWVAWENPVEVCDLQLF